MLDCKQKSFVSITLTKWTSNVRLDSDTTFGVAFPAETGSMVGVYV